MDNNEYYSKKVADTITGMLAYWDENQICRFANHAYMEWFGKDNNEMIDKITLKELLGPLYEKNLPYIEEAYKGNFQMFEREIPTPDGKIRSSIATYTPDIVDGKVRGIIVHVADVSYLKKIEMELELAKERAEELATHDYLTGLPNRVLLNDRMVNSISLAERNGTKIAVCILDMDNFKQVNDTYGHMAGDEVLKMIAERSKSVLREYDTISRIGGDEFVLLLLDIGTIEQVEITLNRLLEISAKPLELSEGIIHPTFSIGVATFPRNGINPEILLKNADKALYESKKSGKNNISYYRG